MKLLVLLQGRQPEDQVGYHRAYERMVTRGRLEWYQPLPYRTETPDTERHWPRLYEEALQIIRDQGVDCLMLQWFHGAILDPRPFLEKARLINPGLVVITTCGDGFGRWFHQPPDSLRWASAESDLTFMTSMGYMADSLIRAGGRNIVLMPNGPCQERFAGPFPATRNLDFDLVFIGSNNGGRNPFTLLSRGGRMRRQMIRSLEARYGKRFAVYGRGWEGHPSWQGPIPYTDQHAVVQRARLQVGGFPGSYAPYYTSDRFYIALASGVPLLDFAVSRVDRLAEPHRHWVPYQDLSSLMLSADQMLDRPQEDLDAMGAAARAFVLGDQTQAHRAEEMLDIASEFISARKQGLRMRPPRLRCFHSGVDPEAEWPYAVRAWHG